MKTPIETIHELESSVKASIQNANDLKQLLSMMEDSKQDEKTLLALLHALRRTFIHQLEVKALSSLPVESKAEENEEEGASKKMKINNKKNVKIDINQALQKFRKWLQDQFTLFIKNLLAWLHHKKGTIRVAALRTLFVFIERGTPSSTSCSSSEEIKYYFDNDIFNKLILSAVCQGFDKDVLSALKSEFLTKYDDVKYYTMSYIQKLLKSKSINTPINSTLAECDVSLLVTNSFDLLISINMPITQDEIKTFLVPLENTSTDNYDSDDSVDKGSKKRSFSSMSNGTNTIIENKMSSKASLKAHRKVFSDAITTLLKLPLPISVYKTILLNVPDKVIPYLNAPLAISDFLTDSYDKGGIIALLALNGLFILITQHELDYPDFYTKLYKMQTVGMFHATYRSKFFKLMELFLNSTHLPIYLVAAFAKKLSRLSLSAPPSGILWLIPFIYNLLQKHAASMVLIHRKIKGKVEGEEESFLKGIDPFLMNEDDPSKCKAIDSSLWEMQTLTSHYDASVSNIAKIFTQKMSKKKIPLEDLTAITYKSLFDAAMKRKKKTEVHMQYEKPKRMFEKDSMLKQVFNL